MLLLPLAVYVPVTVAIAVVALDNVVPFEATALLPVTAVVGVTVRLV